jgi:hypothetical protein
MVVVRIVPSIADKSVQSEVTIFAAGEDGVNGRPLVQRHVRASLIDPFEGFPDRATLHRDGDEVELRIADAYLNDPLEARLIGSEAGWSVPFKISASRTLRASMPSEANAASDDLLLEVSFPARGSVFRAWARVLEK